MTVLLLDGRNALFRHQHANRGLTTAAGMPTGAVYGTLLALCARRAQVGARVVEVCWEGHGEHWRHRLYPDYKRRRPDHKRAQAVAAVAQQEPWAQELLTLCGVRQWRPDDGEGEGDDALAARAAAWCLTDDVVVETGDADLCQVVADPQFAEGDPPPGMAYPAGKISLWKDGTLWGPGEVEGRLGVEPARVPDLKALLGDSSDNYPGCPGVGPKSARGLLGDGRVPDLLARAAAGEVPGKVGQALVQHADLVLTCLRLARVDAKASLVEDAPDQDERSLAELLRRLEFRSLATPHRLEALGRLGSG